VSIPFHGFTLQLWEASFGAATEIGCLLGEQTRFVLGVKRSKE